MTQIRLYVYIAIALGSIGILGFSHYKAYTLGKDVVLNKLKDDRIRILKDGKEIDEQVLSADDDALCILLGGC